MSRKNETEKPLVFRNAVNRLEIYPERVELTIRLQGRRIIPIASITATHKPWMKNQVDLVTQDGRTHSYVGGKCKRIMEAIDERRRALA